MGRNLYTLLVGINKYQTVKPLDGCVDDIKSVKNFLENRLDEKNYTLHCKELIDNYATRNAIINDGFNHLSQAGTGDVVLFYFCGHGAREKVGEEFKDWQLDNAHETLVCYDSRSQNTDGTRVPDLADKELRYLISQVANKGENSPDHVLVVFDCCHSSSGTRDLDDADGIRQLDDVAPARQYSDFCFAHKIKTEELSPETFPQGDHTFIAACLNTETAKEIPQENLGKRGLFTYSLIKELESQNATLSYENLIHEVRTRVTGVRLYQNPQLESVKGTDPAIQSKTRSENPETLAFLGDPAIIKPRDPSFTLKYRRFVQATGTDPEQQEEWIINAGAFQGIQESMELAVYPEGSKYEDFEIRVEKENGNNTEELVKPGSQLAIARIKIIEVRANESVVKFVPQTLREDIDIGNKQSPAIVIKRPIPKVLFYFEAEEEADRELLGKVKKKLLEEWRSLAVGVVDDRKQAHQYRLYVRNQQFEIRDGIDNRLLIERFAAKDNDSSISLAANRVEDIAKWITTRDLENPNSSISKDGIEIEVTYQGVTSKEPHLVLYQQDNDTPKIRVKIKNQSGKRLFFTILDICDDFSINVAPIIYDGHNQAEWLQIEGGGEYQAKLKDGTQLLEDMPIGIPNERSQLTKYGETLKLIASTHPFPVEQFKPRSLPTGDSGEREFITNKKPPVGDWVTKQFSFTFIRPKNSVDISSNTPTELSEGISIQGPDGFSAKATLKPASTISNERGLDNTAIELPLLKDAEPFDLIDRRRGDRSISQIPDQQLSILELSGDDLAIDRVTPESPIVISSDRSLQPEECVLALINDGNFWLPVGYSRETEDGKTEIKVEHLVTQDNNDTQDGDRNVFGAICICFQKVVLRKKQTAWLRMPRLNSDGTFSFNPKEDLKSVSEAVKQAKRIVLFIHGILGDTESMIPSVQDAGLLNSNGSQDQRKYDLVLTFDYENLNTKIEDTAKMLKEKLNQIGLGDGHEKTLHIIAHSMGGLVSRSFIEQQGGNKVVNHLFMLGTPNGGSEWSSVYQLTTLFLSVGLNFIPKSFVAGPFVSFIAKKGIERISPTLKQMNIRDSDILPELKQSEDPQCPYTIIAGDTRLEQELNARTENLLQALKQKVWKGLEFPFKGHPNDIAVTVERIFAREVFEGRNPAVNFIDPIACNHLNYFQDKNGLNALNKAVNQAFD